MLGDHWVWIVLLLLVALVVFGPKRLPELGQAVGKALNEFKKASQSVGDEAKSLTTIVQSGTDGMTSVQPANSGVVPTPEVSDIPTGRSDSAG